MLSKNLDISKNILGKNKINIFKCYCEPEAFLPSQYLFIATILCVRVFFLWITRKLVPQKEIYFMLITIPWFLFEIWFFKFNFFGQIQLSI